MSRAGKRLIQGAKEAVSIAKGERPAASIWVKGHKYVPAALDFQNRVDFKENGCLDEVCSSRGAHLEYMGDNRWFLIFYHEDGTESAFWFESKDLKRPFWERRGPRPSPSTQEK